LSAEDRPTAGEAAPAKAPTAKERHMTPTHILAFALTITAVACTRPASDTRGMVTGTPSDSGAPVARASQQLPWNQRVAFTPVEVAIAGIPIAMIDSTWVAATVLRPALLPSEAFADSVQDPIRATDFGVGGDFNHDGARDSAMVGVYRTHSDTLGRFLLVLTRTAAGWKKSFLTTEPDRPFYSSVTVKDGTLGWWDCRRCDFSFDFKWDRGEYRLLPAASGTE
jgi:hypothetical protein